MKINVKLAYHMGPTNHARIGRGGGRVVIDVKARGACEACLEACLECVFEPKATC